MGQPDKHLPCHSGRSSTAHQFEPGRIRLADHRRSPGRAQGRTRPGIDVVSINPDGITIRSGERIPTGHASECTGMRANPLTRVFPVETDRLGRVAVDEFMRVNGLGDRPSIRPCSRFAPRFRWAMAFSASAQPSARTVPLNTSRRCRSGAKSSEDCASSISVATRLTPSPVLATETCGFPARI